MNLTLKSEAKLEYINVSAYKFVKLEDLPERRNELLSFCNQLDLKGTILLSAEGINLFVAGVRENMDQLLTYFEDRPEYEGLPVKESVSDEQPFSRMLVRIKKEIITFNVPGISPEHRTSPKLAASKLKEWLDQGRDITLLDVRNDYEIDLGTFQGAVPIGVDHFRQFPNAVGGLADDLKTKPLVMFCTGGIRCEKAGPFMEQQGFEEIYQLDGGILRYFEDCGGEHYNGECFVFDKRVAVDPDLNETETTQCYACQHPLTIDDQNSEYYDPGNSCPFCYRTPAERMQEKIMLRQPALDLVANDLPGSKPYSNQRPLNVPERFDRQSVLEFLTNYHPHVDRQRWEDAIANSKILYKDQPVSSEDVVRAGMRLDHLIPETVEPDVNGKIELIYEDDAILVVNKPAPLPMHPCGRFNRNSLVYILNGVYSGEKIRMAHRLDANTTGCVILCRKRAAAQKLQQQFVAGTVGKVYFARVIGRPDSDQFSITESIASEPSTAGIRMLDENGLEARTDFQFVRQLDDGTSLIRCMPKTGRTNQIRLHLWSCGIPILGDPIYLPEKRIGERQTKSVGEPAMCLHAYSIEFTHPETTQPVAIESSKPEWWVA